MEFQKFPTKEIKKIEAEFIKLNKPKYSNIYQDSTSNFSEVFIHEDTLLEKRDFNNFSRIYFLSNSISKLFFYLDKIKEESIINYPYRIRNEELEKAFEFAGFKLLSLYIRLYNININEGLKKLKALTNNEQDYVQQGFKVCIKPNIEDAQIILQILNENFSPYTDYIPSLDIIKDFIRREEILINKNKDNKISGLIIFKITGVKCYQNFWWDNAGMGLFLMKALYQLMEDKKIKVTNFWVNCKNKNVLKIHKMLGSVEDGMHDTTYLKK